MKTRHGFVSNSSTSSFTCDICDEEYTGWDACPSQFDCSTCENEHVMCNSHIKDQEPPEEPGCEHKFDREKQAFCSECGKPAWVEFECDDFDLSSKQCPICQFEAYCNSEMATYLEKTRNISQEVLKYLTNGLTIQCTP